MFCPARVSQVSLARAPGDCEFWTIKTLMTGPGRWRGNSEPGLVQIVKRSQPESRLPHSHF